ncbi:hypothetical protein [Microbacterium flavum]|uniref:Uncharacterized protein n=1 Tax=Microbacterium flavum TaxID=415216 RepID=A0ABS5XU33_9MICO|nr:hypothetical protein [Microbacterium flavum]MBT8798025.1 hypothetical protein [Microbacterium flavum]
MKLVSYAGQQLATTDDVADALVTLAAAIASEGESQALQIPVLVDGREDCADLIVGVGNDILVGPQASADVDPDFSEDAERLRAHPLFPQPAEDESDAHGGSAAAPHDVDLSGIDLDHGL